MNNLNQDYANDKENTNATENILLEVALLLFFVAILVFTFLVLFSS
jgi:hypothetical protein